MNSAIRCLIGDAAEIRRLARRKQKNDHRDADHILDLLIKDEFPRLHRPSPQSQEVMRQLRYRHRLVKIRTMIKNNLHALALGAGVSLRTQIRTVKGRERLEALALPSVLGEQRDEWLRLLDTIGDQIAGVEKWLTASAQQDERVMKLQTHPGIGLITSLALVHTLEPVSRFSTARKVVAYVGLDPVEHSSAERKRFGSISKEGCRFLRFLMVETAQKAVNGDQELKAFYYRLVQRKERSKAKVAVARKLLTEITREVVRAIECSCYGYNQARTNSRDGSLSRGAHLPQHAHELPVSLSRVRPRLARPVAALAL
ncbi:MAG: IS110 family transposase [Pyrinomonadaceae bacterium]